MHTSRTPLNLRAPSVMGRALACALLISMSPSAQAKPLLPGNTPSATVRAWYAWAIAGTQRPYSEAEQAEANGLMAPQLLAELQAQRAHERQCARQTPPGEKPHMLDQSPFFAQPDAVDELRSVAATAMAADAKVAVTLRSGTRSWTDVVLLRQDGGKWYVTDIRWGEGGSLRGRLVDFVKQPCRP